MIGLVRPEPYIGTEPYIFISYAHRNSDQVMPVLTRLTEAGFRIWFDDGIAPGSEWDDNIAQHARECSFFLAFMSNEYLASENCRDELSFARDLNKEKLLVYLEEVELPDGLKMRLNRLQAIHLYRVNWDRGVDQIGMVDGVQCCREGAITQDQAPADLNTKGSVRKTALGIGNSRFGRRGKGKTASAGGTSPKRPWYSFLFYIPVVPLGFLAMLFLIVEIVNRDWVSTALTVFEIACLVIAVRVHAQKHPAKPRYKHYAMALAVVFFILSCFTVANEDNSGAAGESGVQKTAAEISQMNKPARDGFDETDCNTVQVSNYSFLVPDYWETEVNGGDAYTAYAETGSAVAMLQIVALYDDTDPVSFDILRTETENGKMDASIQEMFKTNATIYHDEFDNGTVKGYIYSCAAALEGKNTQCKILMFPDVSSNSWVAVSLVETNNTEYTYFGDYQKILESITK